MPPPCPLLRSFANAPLSSPRAHSMRDRSDAGDAGRRCPRGSCSDTRDAVPLRPTRHRAERARAAGHKVYADTSIRIGHVGAHEYVREDAGADRDRFASYSYTFNA